jgi:GntR family transcriptional repressor for pyruvate dehydrogenase complex
MRYEKVVHRGLAGGVARQIREAILDGSYQPGDQLPPERELAAQFGVDRHTLRSAMQELERLGLVERRQGSGCRVLDYRETGSLDLVKHLVVRPGTDEIDPARVAPVLEVGRATYHGLIELAVQHAGPEDYDAMRAALDALGAAVAEGEIATIIDAERRFFRVGFRATHSLTAELLINTFDQVFTAAIDPEGAAWQQEGESLSGSGRLEIYHGLIEAFERRDVEAARRVVDVVMDGVTALVASPARPSRAPRRKTKTA